MAATITIANDSHTAGLGNMLVTCGTLNLGSSYTASGEPVTAGTLGMENPIAVIIGCAGGYVFEWDATNETIWAFEAGADGAALDEVTAATDLSSYDPYFIAIGR